VYNQSAKQEDHSLRRWL